MAFACNATADFILEAGEDSPSDTSTGIVHRIEKSGKIIRIRKIILLPLTEIT